MDWFEALSTADAADITGLIENATAIDGVAPVSEAVVLSLTGGSGSRHLVHLVDDRVAGYANFVPGHGEHPAMIEAAVHPDLRGRGIGTELVAAALDAGDEAGVRVWAHGDLPPARRVAAKLGLAPVRELLQLRRTESAGELPELVIPEGVRLRTYAGPADDAELLRVNNAAFDWHPEQGGWTEADVAARRAESWFDPLGLFIAEDPAAEQGTPGSMLGFHWTKVHTGAEPLGEVYVVGIDPAAQGRGLGRLLTLAGLHHLRVRGLTTVLLYTEGDNLAALHTYDRLGFVRHAVDMAYAAPSDAVINAAADRPV
ncbi:mycothiol synthase [Aldersonia sp. NBC_00410]|uniref:mycothiol synthase n=1 Tax=Aldersonia sp. NBC_00410 TaxID=2975954 RepID=UPI00224EE4A3|nr:mycothiol synthase [Aldersonia sp. NBC_00410]MCX5043452.1 mycothiol synthase [Aldersonia sp. NBC_00410]